MRTITIFGAVLILLGDAAVAAAIVEHAHPLPALAGWLGISIAGLLLDAILLAAWWLFWEVNF